ACCALESSRFAGGPGKTQQRAEGNALRISVALAHLMHKPQNVAHLSARILELLRTIHDKVGALAFLWVRRLLGEKRGELFLRHPRPAEDTLTLQIGRRRHDDNGIAVPLASGLEQERHIEDNDGSVADLRLGKERMPGGSDQWVPDRTTVG